MSQTGCLPAPALLSAAIVAASLGCGHKGDPLPPLRRTPPGLAEFRLAQRGDGLEVSLLTPQASVDGLAFERIVVEILFAEGARDLEKAGERREILAYPRQRVAEVLKLPAPGTVVRAAARGIVGKESGTRTLTMALVAQAPVAAPRELAAELVAEGVRLSWLGEPPEPVSAAVLPPRLPGMPAQTKGGETLAAPPTPAEAMLATDAPPDATTVEPRKAGFFLYRRVGTESYRLPLAQEPLLERAASDATAPAGATACYVVRAVASIDPLVESAASNEACLEVRDVQPPAAPSGLAVLPRARGLEVVWTPSTEGDLAGYRVYRQAPDGVETRVAEVEAERSSWLDSEALPGVQYHYTVTAVDRAGNESPKAPASEASLPSSRP